MKKWIKQPYPVEAEGWRIGLAVCKLCGCVVLLGGDMKDDSLGRHERWHAALEKKKGREPKPPATEPQS